MIKSALAKLPSESVTSLRPLLRMRSSVAFHCPQGNTKSNTNELSLHRQGNQLRPTPRFPTELVQSIRFSSISASPTEHEQNQTGSFQRRRLRNCHHAADP